MRICALLGTKTSQQTSSDDDEYSDGISRYPCCTLSVFLSCQWEQLQDEVCNEAV